MTGPASRPGTQPRPGPASDERDPYLQAEDHRDLFVPHAFEEHLVDLGEVRLNYAVTGRPDGPALLLIPAQTESWWGYEAVMQELAADFQVYAVDLRGQGRSTWTPGRYSLDLFGGDLVRFIERVVARPVVVAGLSSGGTVAAWLSAFAAPGQVRAALWEDAPLFASEVDPAVGHSIRQGVGPVFSLWSKWLGAQWSVGDYRGMVTAMPRELPAATLAGLARMAPAGTSGPSTRPPQDLREYDPEWGEAFVSGRATLNCDHDNMLRHVKVPVLFTHHFRHVDPDTGTLTGAISDAQVSRVRQLVEGTGSSFTYRSFPETPHSMHAHEPATYVAVLRAWAAELDITPDESTRRGGHG